MALALDASEIHRLSSEKYHEFVECGALRNAHVELLEGLMCDMSPRTREHELIVAYLNRLLADRLDRSYQLRVASALTIGDSEPEPDIAVVKFGTPAPYHPASAELAIEVAVSSLRRDLVVKPRIYASADIPEYWVIDIEGSRAIVHRDPTQEGYRSRIELGPGGALDGSVVGIGEIHIADVLAAAGST